MRLGYVSREIAGERKVRAFRSGAITEAIRGPQEGVFDRAFVAGCMDATRPPWRFSAQLTYMASRIAHDLTARLRYAAPQAMRPAMQREGC